MLTTCINAKQLKNIRKCIRKDSFLIILLYVLINSVVKNIRPQYRPIGFINKISDRKHNIKTIKGENNSGLLIKIAKIKQTSKSGKKFLEIERSKFVGEIGITKRTIAKEKRKKILREVLSFWGI